MNPDAKQATLAQYLGVTELRSRMEALEQRVAALEKLFSPQAGPAMQPGEIPVKAWVVTEAQRCGVTRGAIYNRLSRGQYPKLPVRRVSGKIRYVLT